MADAMERAFGDKIQVSQFVGRSSSFEIKVKYVDTQLIQGSFAVDIHALRVCTRISGVEVWSKLKTGRFPEAQAIVRLVAQQLGMEPKLQQQAEGTMFSRCYVQLNANPP